MMMQEPYEHLGADAEGTALAQTSCQGLGPNPLRAVAYDVATGKACDLRALQP